MVPDVMAAAGRLSSRRLCAGRLGSSGPSLETSGSLATPTMI